MADLPQNVRAERALLGVLLSDNDALFAIGDLPSTDFSESYNGELYLLIRDQIEAGRTASAATIMHDAQDAVIWGDMKASDYLFMLEREAPPSRMAPELARVIRDTALRSRVIQTAEEIAKRARDAPVSVPADELRSEIDEAMQGLFPTIGDMGIRKSADVGDEILRGLRENTGTTHGLNVGLARVQDLTGPLLPGKLYMVAAASGGGKSALIVQMARYMAKTGHTSLIFSMEMDAEEFVGRILASQTGIEAPMIEQSAINPSEYQLLADAVEDDRTANLYIDETSEPTMSLIRGRALRKKRLGGLDALFVDHIHYVKKPDRKMSEDEALNHNLRLAKATARDLHIPVVCACHFTSSSLRFMEAWPHPRPKKGDILFSGTVDRHADVIVMLHRPEYFLLRAEPEEDAKHRHEWAIRKENEKGTAELILGKRRGGKGYGIRKLYFDEKRVAFSDQKPKETVQDDGFTF